MCGIAGFKTHRRVEPSSLKKMIDSLYHRGPDSDGYLLSDSIQMGMRRLSINDLTSGDQPLYNEDRTVALLYNGEIYNSPQLRRELEGQGIKFRTHSDGEVICHLYAKYGADLFGRLDGMFAAALWLEKDRKLILARDIPGEKPLYFTRLSENEIAFSSEIKSLKLFPGINHDLNLQALWDFPSFLWIPEPATIYNSIEALERGHILIADDSGIRVRPYNHEFEPYELPQEEGERIAEVRRVVTKSVHSRLLSDVPVGSFLSGGLDSSIVATLASKVLPSLQTFTIGFENVADPYHGTANESLEAEEYARALGTQHHTLHVTAKDFKMDLYDFCKYGDQPFSVSSGLGILQIAKAARNAGVKVLLSGDGADECFGGYSWYSQLDSISKCISPSFFPEEDDTFQSTGLSVPQRLRALARYPGPKRAWAWHYYASEREKRSLFNHNLFSESRSSLRYFEQFKSSPEWEPNDYIRQDRNFYFPFEMLRKVDRMTMAHSIEGRVPFAAPHLLALANSLSFNDCVRGDTLKWILRRAFSDILPDRVIKRPKHGFNVPIDYWLKNDWSDLLEASFAPSSALAKTGLIAKDAIEVARRLLWDPRKLNGHVLFSYIMLNLWLEERH